MKPHPGAFDVPIQTDDKFDVPVMVRWTSPLDPPRRPFQADIDGAEGRLPIGGLPGAGRYMARTTWREVLHAALSVGRDVTPWLTHLPNLASREILARQAPLMAYLRREPMGSGHGVIANEVYLRGTERSTRAMFGYLLGMTMSEWLCWGRLGMSHSLHAESSQPLGVDPAEWEARSSKPDLLGRHTSYPHQWIVEAKGKRRLGRTALRQGAEQLDLSDVMDGPYRKVLCGTSIEHRLFMTLDLEQGEALAGEDSGEAARRPSLGEDDVALYHEARANMLIYLVLQATQATARIVRPVGRDTLFAARGAHESAVTLLEDDEATTTLRADIWGRRELGRIKAAGGIDMLTAAVPGTSIEVGMSRRLFGACERLAGEQRAIALTAEAALERWGDGEELPAVRIAENGAISEVLMYETVSPAEAAEDRRNERRRDAYRREESQRRALLLDAVRRGFNRGEDAGWRELTDAEPTVEAIPRTRLLESATTDVYVAVEAGAVP